MSYNSLFGLGSHSEDANLEIWCPMQDDAASTTVVDQSSNGNDGTLAGGSNTADLSTTGPNNWLTKGLDLSATGDELNLGDFVNMAAGDFFFGVRLNPATWPGTYTVICEKSTSPTNREFGLWINTSGDSSYSSAGGGGGTATSFDYSFATSTWSSLGFRRSVSTVTGTKNGVAVSNSSSISGTTAIAADLIVGGNGGSTNTEPDVVMSEVCFFSRTLTDAESLQLHDGPEPINSVAPAISGTETEGQTLSVTTGTWGLDSPFSSGSNGTITYAYQWTRSNDEGGTGEADISGATSSTYTLQASDVGKYIRCRVAASNDGGNDADADTNSDMSGAIAAIGATTALSPSPATISLIAPQPTVARNASLSADPSAVTLGLPQPTIAVSRSLSPTAAAVSVQAPVPSLSSDIVIAPDPLLLPLNVPNPTVVTNFTAGSGWSVGTRIAGYRSRPRAAGWSSPARQPGWKFPPQ